MYPRHESSPVSWVALAGFLVIALAILWPVLP
jgi:hypothetical protein